VNKNDVGRLPGHGWGHGLNAVFSKTALFDGVMSVVWHEVEILQGCLNHPMPKISWTDPKGTPAMVNRLAVVNLRYFLPQ